MKVKKVGKPGVQIRANRGHLNKHHCLIWYRVWERGEGLKGRKSSSERRKRDGKLKLDNSKARWDRSVSCLIMFYNTHEPLVQRVLNTFWAVTNCQSGSANADAGLCDSRCCLWARSLETGAVRAFAMRRRGSFSCPPANFPLSQPP